MRRVLSIRRKLSGEEGTILLLVPAGLLVMILLGAMAFDLSLAYAGERRLADLAAAWANDALARIDLEAWYEGGGEPHLDQEAARRSVFEDWRDLEEFGFSITTAPTVTFPDERTIVVSLVGEVPLLFLDVLPGIHHRTVDTVSTATLVVTG